MVRQLRDNGVTIILTTHYIEEAEEMADRIGVINRGELVLVEEKAALMSKLGSKQLTLNLHSPLTEIPANLQRFELSLAAEGHELIYTYDGSQEEDGHAISELLTALEREGVTFKDLNTRQSSLEDIFVDLVKERA